MLRAQGLSILSRVRSQIASNRVPAVELLEGAFLLVGGALLLTPGFVTDTVGIMCLLPIARQFLVRTAVARFSVRGTAADPRAGADHPKAGRYRDTDSNTIEGEYRRDK
jgi:UPF0716 protein FxsA